MDEYIFCPAMLSLQLNVNNAKVVNALIMYNINNSKQHIANTLWKRFILL